MKPTEAPEPWEKRFERYKKDQVVSYEPHDYIHCGLNDAAQFSDLINDIRTIRAEAATQAVAEERKKFAQILVKISNESVDGVASRIQEHIALLLNRP